MRAFPRPGNVDPTQGTLEEGDHYIDEQDGMQLRDYFAAKAMQSLLTRREDSDLAEADCAWRIAIHAVVFADALIRRLYP